MNTVYIGIDLHKRTQTWVALADNGTDVLFTKEFEVTPEAVRQGIVYVQKLATDKIVAAIEPTCGWLWVVPLLRAGGMEVHISNPRKVKAIADSMQKTDKNDATMLARLVRTSLMHESTEVDPAIQALRALVRERVFLVRLRASMKCRLESVVTRSGRHLIVGTLSSDKGRVALLEQGTPEWSRALSAIADLSRYINILDKDIAIQAKQPIPKLLMTLPGIGIITAVSVWAEVGDFGRFPSPDKLCAFAGLVPAERSSGGVQRMGHITKTGSNILRYMLVEAALRVRDTDASSTLYQFYKTIKTTRGAMKARVALARKLLSISWYMVKKSEKYKQRLVLSAHTPTRGDLVPTS